MKFHGPSLGSTVLLQYYREPVYVSGNWKLDMRKEDVVQEGNSKGIARRTRKKYMDGARSRDTAGLVVAVPKCRFDIVLGARGK